MTPQNCISSSIVTYSAVCPFRGVSLAHPRIRWRRDGIDLVLRLWILIGNDGTTTGDRWALLVAALAASNPLFITNQLNPNCIRWGRRYGFEGGRETTEKERERGWERERERETAESEWDRSSKEEAREVWVKWAIFCGCWVLDKAASSGAHGFRLFSLSFVPRSSTTGQRTLLFWKIQQRTKSLVKN